MIDMDLDGLMRIKEELFRAIDALKVNDNFITFKRFYMFYTSFCMVYMYLIIFTDVDRGVLDKIVEEVRGKLVELDEFLRDKLKKFS
ncbi:MAG: hypothetical protein ACTSSJ_07770 [Candidatus Odinarchaeia archaeon]